MRRCRAVVCAAVAFAAAASALQSSADAGRFIDRLEIAPGDTVLADVLAPRELDELVVPLPRGAVTRWDVHRINGFVPGVGGLYDDDYASIPLAATPPSFLDSAVLPHSGLYRFVISSGRDTLGGYRVKLTVRPQRSAAAKGTGDGAAAPLVFGAFPGADVDVTLSWKGDAPVTLAALAGPDGAPLPAPDAVVRGRTSTQRGFRTTALGDHTVSLVVPGGTASWSVRVAIRTPALRGSVKDLRTDGLPAPPTLDVEAASLVRPVDGLVDAIPQFTVRGEQGGMNGWIAGAGGTTPNAIPLDGRRGPCGFDGGATPATATRYVFQCASGYRAEIEDVVRDGQGRVLSFAVPSVSEPEGTGSSAFADFTYDAAGAATGWTELRRFDASGREHQLAVTQMQRFPNGVLKSFTVRHTGPDGAVRTYAYGPFQ